MSVRTGVAPGIGEFKRAYEEWDIDALLDM
jgi:hypothetical protein